VNQRKFRGRAVSEVGIGTWQLGGTEWGDITDERAFETLAAAADAGVTFIDTADIYGLGRSESLIGRFLAGRADRDRFFLATKLGRNPVPGWPDNFTKEWVTRHTEASLTRLGVEALDLTQTHCIPQDVMRAGEVFGHLADLQRQGKIKAFGASVETVEEGLECLEFPGLGSLQIIFNVFRQKPTEKLLGEAARRKVAIIVRLPLASGVLAGRFKPSDTFPATDHRNFNRDGQKFNVGETFAGVPFEKGIELAEGLRPWVPAGWTMADFALKWCLEHPEVTTLIPGATRADQARTNARVSDLPPLGAETMAALAGYYREKVAPFVRGRY
jgi:aryl-alcohol dehydrogenase-like predicted oxidoreductase